MRTHYNKLLLVGTIFALLQARPAVAQSKFCGSDEVRQKLYQAHPELLQDEVNYNAAIDAAIQAKKNQRSSSTTEVTYTIPIVFHIIHTYGTENISDAQICDQVNILNRDYAKLNADTSAIVSNAPFDTLVSNIHIQFKLAQIDPNGNCTNGIDRIYSHRTNAADDNSKLNQWPREKYLNVWVVKSIGTAGVAGYAYYPSAVNSWMYPFDGVLILHDYIGSIGTSNASHSRALTHEIGHWLNLQHPWGNNNDPEVACGDDLVDDTPETRGHLSCDLYTPHCKSGNVTGSLNFADVTTSTGTMDPTVMPTDSGVVYHGAMAVGVDANPDASGRFSFGGWDNGAADAETVYSNLTGSINTAKYYEFTVDPKYAYSMTLTAMSFTVERSATGPRTYVVRSSMDGYASNIAASISPANANLSVQTGNVFFINSDTALSMSGSRISLPTTSFKNLYAPVTFRIYAYNAEDAAGSFSIDNVAFAGTRGIIENTQNYMDYSYCSVMFTKGQKDRMRAAAESPISGRNNLWSAANLAATGTDGSGPVCAAKPDFFVVANKTNICVGSSITFNKNILNNTACGTAPTVTWYFSGGSPATSTAAAPTVTYNTAGNYDVKLVATNSAGTDSVVKTSYIHVSGGAAFTGPWAENFEVPTDYFYFWTPENLDAGSNSWGLNSSVGYSGTHSIVMTAYHNYANDVDNLISPSYNLTGVTGGTLTFRSSAASRATSSADMTEKLVIYSSIDCGATWSLRKSIPAVAASGSTLIDNGYHPENYVPTSGSVWTLQSVTLPSTVMTSNTRFKFEYTSGDLGNNLYLDDININGVVGINESSLEDNTIAIYPNPTNQSSTVYYHLNTKADTKIELVDVLGKKLMVTAATQNEGDYSVTISKQELGLRNGIYFVKITVDNHTVTKKLIITE